MKSKKHEKAYAYSASITMKHIQWLQSYPKPQKKLRQILDEAMKKEHSKNLTLLKKKQAKILDKYLILKDALNAKNITEERKVDIAQRMRSTWEEYENVSEKINFLKVSMG